MIKQLYSKLGETSKHLLATFIVYGFISLSIIVLRVLIARLYGQEELGVFTYFFNLVGFVFVFSSFGAADALAKVIAKEGGALKSALRLSILIMLPATIASILVVMIVNYYFNPGIPGVNLAVILYIVLYSLFFLAYSIYRGYKRFVFGSSLSLIYRVLLIAAVFVMFAYRVSFVYFLYVMGLLLIVPAVVAIPSLAKLFKGLGESVDGKVFFYMAVSLFLVQVSFYTLRFVDSLLIKYLTDFVSLGLYSAYASITNVIRLTAYVLPVVVMPMAVKKNYRLKASLKKLLFMLIPFAIVVLIASYVLVPILYGSEYKAGVSLPIALVIASSLMVVYSYLNSVFAGENLFSKRYLGIIIVDVLLTLVGSIVLGVLFAIYFGMVGVPIAIACVVVLKILLNVYGIKSLRKRGGINEI